MIVLDPRNAQEEAITLVIERLSLQSGDFQWRHGDGGEFLFYGDIRLTRTMLYYEEIAQIGEEGAAFIAFVQDVTDRIPQEAAVTFVLAVEEELEAFGVD